MSCPLTIAPSLSRILVMIGDGVDIEEEAVLRLGLAPMRDRFWFHLRATSHRLRVCVKGGHVSAISLLSRRIVRALRTFRNMLHPR